jgi:hypothetical protein
MNCIEIVNHRWTMDHGPWTIDNGQWTMEYILAWLIVVLTKSLSFKRWQNHLTNNICTSDSVLILLPAVNFIFLKYFVIIECVIASEPRTVTSYLWMITTEEFCLPIKCQSNADTFFTALSLGIINDHLINEMSWSRWADIHQKGISVKWIRQYVWFLEMPKIDDIDIHKSRSDAIVKHVMICRISIWWKKRLQIVLFSIASACVLHVLLV